MFWEKLQIAKRTWLWASPKWKAEKFITEVGMNICYYSKVGVEHKDKATFLSLFDSYVSFSR